MSENHHIYDQNIYFNTVLYVFFIMSDVQYFHYFVNSEILYIDFCHYYFLIRLINYISDHMLDHDYEVNSDNMSFWFQNNYLIYFFHHVILCFSWVQYEYNIFAEKSSCYYHFFLVIISHFCVHYFHNFCWFDFFLIKKWAFTS